MQEKMMLFFDCPRHKRRQNKHPPTLCIILPHYYNMVMIMHKVMAGCKIYAFTSTPSS